MTDALLTDPDDLTGTGTIDTHGLVSDVDLVFNATHGLNQVININDNPGRNITINLNVDASGRMGAGYGGSGTMSISNGVVIESTYGYIGYKPGSSGHVTVNGAGSTWTNSWHLYVNSGSLDITDGGSVNNLGCAIGGKDGLTGEVTVDGGSSTWTNTDTLWIGGGYSSSGYGHGIINITGGGTLNSVYTHIGYSSGSTGEVTVSGVGSKWANNSSLILGYNGNGKLNIMDGGEVTVAGNSVVYASNGTIHFDNGLLTINSLLCSFDDLSGTGTVNTHGLVSDVDLVFDATHGLEKTFYVTGNTDQDITVNLTVDGSGTLGAGHGSMGTMRISDGIVINSEGGFIGYCYDSNGEVTVDGAGSTWNISSGFYIGYYGNGTLNITHGGAIHTDDVYIGRRSGSNGIVSVVGPDSKWTNSDRLYVGYVGSGTLDIKSAGEVSCAQGYVGYASGSTGIVTVDGTGSTWKIASYLDIGRGGSGTLNITNYGLLSVGGDLAIDKDADGDGFINMSSGGMLALYGEADGSIAEYLALVEGTDAIRYWDDSISDWADITSAMYCRDYTLNYMTEGDLSGYTVLKVQRAIDGDANGDGVVDVSDLGILATNYDTASGAEWGDGDLNGDGKVDVSDLGILAGNYGSSATSQTVPEPSMLSGLVGLCLIGLLVTKRRGR